MLKFLIDMKIYEKFDWLGVSIIETAYSLVKKNGNKMGYICVYIFFNVLES